MDIVLDELTLIPCARTGIADRLSSFAKMLRALGDIGLRNDVQIVSTALDLDICDGYGLRRWCFDKAVPEPVRNFLATMLQRNQYIDGLQGLLAETEGEDAVEGKVGEVIATGLTYCVISSGLPVGLVGGQYPSCFTRNLTLLRVSGIEEFLSMHDLLVYVLPEEIEAAREAIVQSVQLSMSNGREILDRSNTVFARLRFGARAVEQLESMQHGDARLKSVIRHLWSLNAAAKVAENVAVYDPRVKWSVESKTTLEHSRFGAMRDFPWPNPAIIARWSRHCKVGTTRIYFEPVMDGGEVQVHIGYVGSHLPTVDYPS